MMKLYKVWADKWNYDTYDSMVVVADSEEQARKMKPVWHGGAYAKNDTDKNEDIPEWPTVEHVHVKELGTVTDSNIVKPCCVVASYNAG